MKLLIMVILMFHHLRSVTCINFTTEMRSLGHTIIIKYNEFMRKFNLIQNVLRFSPRQLAYSENQVDEEEIEESEEEEAEVSSKKPRLLPPLEYKELETHPTALMPTDRLILLHKRLPEVHAVRTADGYVLILHRVMEQFTNTTRTVLLHHGLMGSSADWLMLGKDISLPYLLSRSGYDVWLINARGNYYSHRHAVYHNNSTQFWNFTWQEMGQQDLPAVINYIRRIKGENNKIDFIGHSMGASALLVLLSTSEIYNNYIRMGVLLAPLAFMRNIKGPLVNLVNASNSSEILNILTSDYTLDRTIPNTFVNIYCMGHEALCFNPLFFLTAGGSTKTIEHYVQLARSGNFHEYGNDQKKFPLNKVTAPIALFSSTDDWLSSVADVRELAVSIANPIKHVVLHDHQMSHTEFVWGAQANELVLRKVLSILNNHNDF